MGESLRVRSLQLPSLFIIFVILCCTGKPVSGSLSSARVNQSEMTGCVELERRALLRLKQGMEGDYKGILSSWGVTEDCCTWRGVGCSNRTGNVISLQLAGEGKWSKDGPYLGFQGEINSALLELNHLSYLDLSLNDFDQLPQFIGSLKNLRFLNLSNIYHLLSPIDGHQLGNLPSLEVLDLSYTYTVVENTSVFSHLSSLRQLHLRNVDLNKSMNWYKDILNLPSLEKLTLSGCRLPPILPREINCSKSLAFLDISYNSIIAYPSLAKSCSGLIDINLSSNGLDGGISSSLGNLSSLRSLDLSGNNLKQELPLLLGKLSSGGTRSSLEILRLDYNKLTGPLPDFSTFSSLRELYLSNNRLNGSFLQHLSQMPSLLIVDLSSNKITGSLPNLFAFASLKRLDLHDNQITGTLPVTIGQLSQLEHLDASWNMLEGMVTEAHFTNLSRLLYLHLSFNNLSSDLHPDWVPPFELDELKLSSVKLGPSFPRWIRTQKTLKHLSIANAGISDTIPNWFWDLTTKLNYLNLSYNQIEGIVPNSLSMSGETIYIDLSSNNFSRQIPQVPSNTRVLNLHNNMFSGSISVMCNLDYTKLIYLDLSHNLLSGELPDCWMNMGSLYLLNLEANTFTGKIPPSLGSMYSIVMLSMRSNSLIGELPSLQKCTYLKFLDLGDNKLTGEIPKWIGENLTDLFVLSLQSNSFHGAMPTSFCTLENIQILDLSFNNISGNIPKCLNNLTGMTQRERLYTVLSDGTMEIEDFGISIGTDHVYMFNTMLEWKGRRSEYRNTLRLVRSLDLSSNKFTGDIPDEITSLVALVALNLSRNNLTGHIPQNIGELRWLDFLDLSRNQLVGRIPTSIAEISNLAVLDLSYNNLSGRIPSSTQLQSFDAWAYTGNNALCGKPLPNECPKSDDEAPQESPRATEGNDDDKLITTEFYISLLLGFSFGFGGIVAFFFLKVHGNMHVSSSSAIS